MKQRFLLILFFTSCLQSLSAQTKIALFAGYNAATARVHYNDIPAAAQFNNGYGLGILFKAPFDGVLHFSPFIAFNQRGYAYTYTTSSNVTIRDNTTMRYIDVAPAVSVDFNVKKSKPDNCIFLSAGPTLSVAINGTEKKQTGTAAAQTNPMHFSIESDYSIVDLGFSFGVGYQTRKWFLQAGYFLGVANIDNNAELDKGNIENRVISARLGYYFK